MKGWLAGHADATVRSFRQRGYKVKLLEAELSRLCSFVDDNFPDEGTLSEDVVKAWLKDSEGLRAYRINSKAVAAARVAEQMIRSGIPAYVTKFRVRKDPVSQPTLLSDEELRIFFETVDGIGRSARAIPPQHKYWPITGPTIFRLMYSSGLRPGEAASLRVEDVDLRAGRIRVLGGKENRDRDVYVSDSMARLLRRFDSRMRSLEPGRAFFFQLAPGAKSITVDQLDCLFKRALRQCELLGRHPKSPTPHSLRHLFASKSMAKARSRGESEPNWIKYLSVYMGHESPDETLYYLHIASANIAEIGEELKGFLGGKEAPDEEE